MLARCVHCAKLDLEELEEAEDPADQAEVAALVDSRVQPPYRWLGGITLLLTVDQVLHLVKECVVGAFQTTSQAVFRELTVTRAPLADADGITTLPPGDRTGSQYPFRMLFL